MDELCIVVFTSRSIERMLSEGGSQAWKLGNTARRCRYLVCTWNAHGEYANPNQPLSHGQAFLVAPIIAVEPAVHPEPPGRCIIRFSEFAKLSLPNAWNGQRNPVWYSSLPEMGIDLAQLKMEKAEVPATAPIPMQRSSPAALTIAAAKQGLSLNYGVEPSAIEITIRG